MEAESILTGEWNVVSGKDDIEHLNDIMLKVFDHEGTAYSAFMKFIKAYTAEIISSNWDFVDRVAAALLEHGRLSYSQVSALR